MISFNLNDAFKKLRRVAITFKCFCSSSWPGIYHSFLNVWGQLTSAWLPIYFLVCCLSNFPQICKQLFLSANKKDDVSCVCEQARVEIKCWENIIPQTFFHLDGKIIIIVRLTIFFNKFRNFNRRKII